MSLSTFIPCQIPKGTAQQKGVFIAGGKPRFFKKAKLRAAEASYLELLRPHAPDKPMDGPLALSLRLFFPWRKAEKKSRIARFANYPIETRPDVDNIAKLIIDAMTTLRFWHDDAQISTLRIAKMYSQSSGIGVNLVYDLATTITGEIASLD